MEILKFLSSANIVVSGTVLAYFVLRKLSNTFFKKDITVTSRKTGKSVVLGEHPQKHFAKKLLDVIEMHK